MSQGKVPNHFTHKEWPEVLPDVFVSRKGHQIDSGEVSVYCHQIKTEEHSQNLNNEPDQSWTRLNTQNLWRKAGRRGTENQKKNIGEYKGGQDNCRKPSLLTFHVLFPIKLKHHSLVIKT